ncbi:MAG: TfoX/Sxy family protein [Dokdonella sp.]
MSHEKIRNVGPKSAAWLRQVGVRTLDDLRETGPVATFLKVKRAGFRPSLNLLYSMAGALEDCHWTDLNETTRQALLTEYEAANAANPIRNRWEKSADRSARRDGGGKVSTTEIGEENETDDGGVRELTGSGGEFE